MESFIISQKIGINMCDYQNQSVTMVLDISRFNFRYISSSIQIVSPINQFFSPTNPPPNNIYLFSQENGYSIEN
jgi:hypothetical protein